MTTADKPTTDPTGSIWEKFFSGFLVQALNNSKADDQSLSEAQFIHNMLKLPPGGKVLDVPCGNGRIGVVLASQGFQVTGIDISQPLLDEAREKVTARQVSLTLEQRDMRDLPWQTEFDGVFCFWESFGFFDDAENLAFLDAVYRTLKPGGHFLVDTHVAETLLPRLRGNDWSRVGDLIVLEARRYDHVEARFEREWTFIQNGKIEQKNLSSRLYTYRELLDMLKKVGFTGCEGYGLLSPKPFAYGDQRLNMVATKP